VEDEIVGSRAARSVGDEAVGVPGEPLQITTFVVEEHSHRFPPEQAHCHRSVILGPGATDWTSASLPPDLVMPAHHDLEVSGTGRGTDRWVVVNSPGCGPQTEAPASV
jgi:hypothetical protein